MKHSCLLFFLFCFLVASAHEEAFVHDYAHQLAQLEHRNQQTLGSASDEWLLDVREATVQTAFPLDGNVQTQVRQKVNTVHRQHPMVRVYVLVSAAIGFDPKDAKLQDWFTSHQQSFEEGPRADDPAHYASEIVNHWTEEGERSEPYKIMLLHFQQVINGAQAYWDVTYGMENTFTNDFLTQFQQNLRLLVNNNNVALNPSGSIYDNIRLVGMAIDNNGASQSKYNIKTTIGDTLLTLNKIYIPTHMRHDPIFKFVPSDSTTSFVNIKLKIVSAENKAGAFYPSTGYLKLDKNSAVTLDLDSLQEGKYQIQCEGTNSCLVNYFYIRKKKAKIPCKYCGRELEFSKEMLRSIYSTSNYAKKSTTADYFNEGMILFGLNSCTRMAHLLSQVYVESNGLNSTEELIRYSLKRMYEIFNSQSNGSGAQMMKQSFIDNKTYLHYVAVSPYYKIDTNKTTRANYSPTDPQIYKNTTDTVKFPGGVNYNLSKGNYFKVTNYSDKTKDSIGTNLMNFVYKNVNGNTNENDGYNFRGRGIIQLTGRYNYNQVHLELKGNNIKDFNIILTPDSLSTNDRIAVLSAFAYINQRFKKNQTLIDGYNSYQVTSLVNTKHLEWQKRETLFLKYIKDYYYGCK